MSDTDKRFTTESTPLADYKKANTNKYYNSIKGGRQSENDDRKTFISSTERQVDSISTRSKGYKPPFKVKLINKKLPSNLVSGQKVAMTPEKHSNKSLENKIIITKRNEGQKIINKKKRVVLDQKLLVNNPTQNKGRFISHERKASAWGINDINPLPLYMSKQTSNSSSTPLIVLNGVNSNMHRHHKSKDTLIFKDQQPKLHPDIQNIYSKPASIPSKSNNPSIKKRKKGRGFPSQHEIQPTQMKLILPSNVSFSNLKKKTSTSRFNQDGIVIPLGGQKQMHNHIFPSYQNINEDIFKNHIVNERSRGLPHDTAKHSKTERDKQLTRTNKKGRGSVGSLIT